MQLRLVARHLVEVDEKRANIGYANLKEAENAKSRGSMTFRNS